MQAYIGKEGEIVVRLPAEMGLGAPMYRVKFDDMEALAFFARELDRIGV